MQNNQWKHIGDQFNSPRKDSYVRISYVVTIRLFAAIVVLRCLDPFLFATQESDRKIKEERRFSAPVPPVHARNRTFLESIWPNSTPLDAAEGLAHALNPNFEPLPNSFKTLSTSDPNKLLVIIWRREASKGLGF